MKKEFKLLTFAALFAVASTSVHAQDWNTTGNASLSNPVLGTTDATTFNVITNGTTRMTFNANGKVGIGPYGNGTSSQLLVQGNPVAIQADSRYDVAPAFGYTGISGNGLSNDLTSGSTAGVRGTGIGAHDNFGGYFRAIGGLNTTNIAVYGNCPSFKGQNNWAGYFDGRVYSSVIFQTSDRKFKSDIRPLANALDKLMLLKPSTYNFKTEEYKSMNLPQGRQIGLIAQDLEAVFPELVTDIPEMKETSENGEVSIVHPAFKAVQYTSLIPVLIAGVQAQQDQFNEQQQQIIELTKLVKQLQASLENKQATSFAGAEIQAAGNNEFQLYQVTPNPVKQSAIINYRLPGNTSNARLIITDATGKTMQSYMLSGGSKQQVINTNQLPAGLYYCSLTVNGKIVDSKKMEKL